MKRKLGLILVIILSLTLFACDSGKVSIKLPQEFTEDFYFFTRETVEKYADKVKEKGDGVQVVFTEEKHKDLVAYFKKETEAYFKMIEDDQEDLYYIDRVECEEDFSKIKVFVNGEEHKPDEDFSLLVIGMCGSLNRIYMGEDPNFTIEYHDSATKEVISSEVFPGKSF